ncbi:MAG: hypothetical protein ABIP30_14510 [Ferruginibacter sp.]
MRSVLILMFVFSLASCKKTETQNPPPIIPPPVILPTQDDSILLSAYITLDSTATNHFDTSYKYTFVYDNLKRLTQSKGFSYKNGVINTVNYVEIDYLYNSNDTLPIKKTKYNGKGSTQPLITTIFCKYSDNNIIYDSTISQLYPGGWKIHKYNYASNRVTDSSNEINADGGYKLKTVFKTVDIQKINGDIFIQNDTIKTTNYDNNGYIPPYIYFIYGLYNFTYDSNNNPFNKLSNLAAPTYYNYDTYNLSYDLPNITLSTQKNNPVEIKHGTDYYYKCFYEYKQNGFPKTVRIYNQNSAGNFVKGVYLYTK